MFFSGNRTCELSEIAEESKAQRPRFWLPHFPSDLWSCGSLKDRRYFDRAENGGRSLSREPATFVSLTGMPPGSDVLNFSQDVVINYTHMKLRFEAGMGGLSIPALLLDNAFN